MFFVDLHSTIRTLRAERRAVGAMLGLLCLRVRLPRDLDRTTLPNLLRSLTPTRKAAYLPSVEIVRMRRAFARIEAVCSRARIVEDTCLYRSIGRYAAWRRLGVPVRFVMAVRRDGSGDIGGHAWIERDGTPDNEDDVAEYVVTYAFPA